MAQLTDTSIYTCHTAHTLTGPCSWNAAAWRGVHNVKWFCAFRSISETKQFKLQRLHVAHCGSHTMC